jgi:hypothetical protein
MWEELIQAIHDNNTANVAELIENIDQKELNEKQIDIAAIQHFSLLLKCP